MDRTVNLTEARAALAAILDQVEAGDEVTITRHGRPAAVIVQPGALRSRRADAATQAASEVEKRLDKARKSPRPASGLSRRYADTLVAEVRAGRARR